LSRHGRYSPQLQQVKKADTALRTLTGYFDRAPGQPFIRSRRRRCQLRNRASAIEPSASR
jgi:hypothetical protein